MTVTDLLTARARRTLSPDRQLAAWLAATGQTGTSISREIGVSQALVSRLFAGHPKPSPTVLAWVEEHVGIPAADWKET